MFIYVIFLFLEREERKGLLDFDDERKSYLSPQFMSLLVSTSSSVMVIV